MKPIVLMDVDGVVADFVDMYLRWAPHVQSCSLDGRIPAQRYAEDVTSWNIAASIGLTEIEERRLYQAFADHRLCRELKPYPDAIEQVNRLRESCDVVFVTSPLQTVPTWAHDRDWWLRKHLGDNIKVVHTKHKQYVQGDWLIDDGPHNLNAWALANDNYDLDVEYALCIARPWNRQVCPRYTLNEAVNHILIQRKRESL